MFQAVIHVRLDDVWPSCVCAEGKQSVVLVGATGLPDTLATDISNALEDFLALLNGQESPLGLSRMCY